MWEEGFPLDLDGDSLPSLRKQLDAILHDTTKVLTLLSTLVALYLLQHHFAEPQQEWQLLAQKAEQWLRNLGSEPPLPEPEPTHVARRWQVWFAQRLNA
ncbi:MAG: hypothetical protein Q6J33_05160 [Gloeomargarita sp. DG_2_bins_126]